MIKTLSHKMVDYKIYWNSESKEVSVWDKNNWRGYYTLEELKACGWIDKLLVLENK